MRKMFTWRTIEEKLGGSLKLFREYTVIKQAIDMAHTFTEQDSHSDYKNFFIFRSCAWHTAVT